MGLQIPPVNEQSFMTVTSTIPGSPITKRAAAKPPPQSPAFKALKKRIRLAHGTAMGIVFLGLYPFAALMMRFNSFPYQLWIHIGVQIFAMVLMYIGLGFGIWFGEHDDKLFNSVHTKMGIIIPSLMLLQPVFGYFHHRGYLKSGGRTMMTFVHSNYGRVLIFLGGVNGILGRKNEGTDYAHGQTIFAALFAIVWGVYAIGFGSTAFMKRKGQITSNTEKKDDEVESGKEAMQVSSDSPVVDSKEFKC